MTEFKFAICVKNDGYEVSLEIRKVYELLQDSVADSHGMLRVVDESGEDYLFPKDFFIPIDLPAPIQTQLSKLI
jgi:hypothetical protein